MGLTQTTRRSISLYHLSWLPPLAGLVVLAAFTLWLMGRALAYPYQLLHGEGVMLEFSRRLAAGEPIYKPLADTPPGTCNYAPLPLLLARVTFPILGLGFAAGRIWAVIATLAIGLFLFDWVRQATGRIVPAAVAGLAWLGLPYVYHWAPQFRVDLPGLAFSFGGMYVLWRGVARTSEAGGGQQGPGQRAHAMPVLVAAALLFVLGLYCKQSFLAAPAAALLYLLARDRRKAMIMAAAIALLGGVPFLILIGTTHGEFWNSLVSANVNPFDPGLLLSQLAGLVRTYYPLLILAVTYAVLWKRGAPAPAGHRARGLIALYVALAMLTGLLAGKVGSWENYFLEPLAAVCLAAGLGLATLVEKPAVKWVAPLLVLLQVGMMWHTPAQAARIMRDDGAANRALIPRVAAAPGPVQSEDMGLLILAGKPVPYYDFQLTQLALAGRWDQGWEVDKLRHGAFSMVIFEGETRIDVEKYGRYTRTFVSALDYGYRRAGQVGKYHVYTPAPLDRDRRLAIGDSLTLVGHTLPPPQARAGDRLSLDIVWQATRANMPVYTSFVHVVDAGGRRVTGDDRQPWQGLYPTSAWAEGEMVRMSYTLTLPTDLPSGLYTVRAGWYDETVTRLFTAAGEDSVPLAVIDVPPAAGTPGQDLSPLSAQFEGVALAGYRMKQEPGRVDLLLLWQPGAFLDTDYTIFVHLRNAAGQTVAQADGPPMGGLWPTTLWRPGVTVKDVHTLALTAGLPPGSYSLVVGLYDPATERRLPLVGGGDEVIVGEVELP